MHPGYRQAQPGGNFLGNDEPTGRGASAGADRVRDALLRAAGLTVLRVPNRKVPEHSDRVLDRIRALLQAGLPSPCGRGVRG